MKYHLQAQMFFSARVTTNKVIRFDTHVHESYMNSAIYLQDAIRLEDCLYNEYLFIKIVMRVKIYKDLVLSENQNEIKTNGNRSAVYILFYVCVYVCNSLYNIILTTFWHRTVY